MYLIADGKLRYIDPWQMLYVCRDGQYSKPINTIAKIDDINAGDCSPLVGAIILEGPSGDVYVLDGGVKRKYVPPDVFQFIAGHLALSSEVLDMIPSGPDW